MTVGAGNDGCYRPLPWFILVWSQDKRENAATRFQPPPAKPATSTAAPRPTPSAAAALPSGTAISK